MSGRQWVGALSSFLLALVLALTMWFVSTETQRRIESETGVPAGAGLSIEFVGSGPDRAVYDPDARTTTVDLRGFRSGMAALDPAADLRVVADVGQAAADTAVYTVPVSVECSRCARLGVRVVRPTVGEVTVKLGRLVTETRSVHVNWPGAAPSGYVITRQSASPAQVSLWGAEVAVQRVQRLVAVIGEPAEIQGEMRFTDVPVVPMDADNQEVVDVKVSPSTVEAELEARRRGIEVSVRPELQGVEADGYYVTGVSMEPQSLQLDGPIENLTALEASGSLRIPVDIDGAASDIVRLVALDDLLPEGVSAVNAPSGVTVTIALTPLPGTRTIEAEVVLRGLGTGLAVQSISAGKVDVLISGPKAELGALSAEDLDVYVDLGGLDTGRHTVAIQVDAPSGYLSRSITPATVDVVIAVVPRPTATIGR